MGRWRSGAPLVLAPEKDDPVLGADMQRNNDFNYKKMDPLGYAVPLGSHCRRMNPRDTAHNMNRRRMIRRGATYGPPLPEGAPEDGVERGIAAFVICASLIRQFEFAQNVWINDKNFHELGNERDPIIGTQDGTLEYKIPKRPIRKRITGLPAFTTVRGGAYFFLPGLKALRYLASLGGDAALSACAPCPIRCLQLHRVSPAPQAQNRGVYPLGMSAIRLWRHGGARVHLCEPFLYYSRNESKGAGRRAAGNGQQLGPDGHELVRLGEREAGPRGARYSASATIPIANNSLASDVTGSISGGGGFADSYYQPVILGWVKERFGIRAIYGFLAPTGRFEAGEADNVGSGYWTHVLASGQTIYLTEGQADGGLRLPDVRVPHQPGRHGRRAGPDHQPGLFGRPGCSARRGLKLQAGTVVGYEQRQTTDKARARYHGGAGAGSLRGQRAGLRGEPEPAGAGRRAWASGTSRSSRTDPRTRAIRCRSPARSPSDGRAAGTERERDMGIARQPGRTYNQDHVPRKYTPRQAAGEHLLDLELSLGGQPEPGGDGQPLLDHDRGSAGGLAGV